jgi:thiol-disulfide isomerase/thioredoxin
MTRFIVPAVLAALVATASGRAHGATMELVGTGQFRVQSKGATDPDARVYRALVPPFAFLVFTPAFRRPVLVTTGTRAARLVDPARVTHDADDPEIVRLDTAGPQEDFLSVRVDGSSLVVERDGVTIALAPSEPVLGDRTLEEVTRALPEYRRNAAHYTPDPRALETLRRLERPAELIVFFGSWCAHCERMMPRLVRVLQDAGGAPIEVTFHGVPPGQARDRMADELRITALPTAIVRRDAKEVARIVDDDWDAPEKSLAAALAGKPGR